MVKVLNQLVREISAVSSAVIHEEVQGVPRLVPCFMTAALDRVPDLFLNPDAVQPMDLL